METSEKPTSPVRVACIQFEPHIGEKPDNVDRSLRFIEQAARNGAKILVLPELCNTGYMFTDPDQAFSLAEPIPDGPTCTAWAAAAKKFNVYICAGIAENDGQVLFNSCVMIGPEGHVGTYRKAHLWDKENLFFKPGNLGFPVFETIYGDVGMLICYDCWFPEAWRSLTLNGADLVCVPTNWVPIPGQDPSREAMSNILCMAAAHSNSIFIAAADRTGVERGQAFVGQSLIVGQTGWPVGGPAGYDTEEIIFADCLLSQSKNGRTFNDFNEILSDRRIDSYR